MLSLREVLIARDRLTPEEADDTIAETRESIREAVEGGACLRELEELLQYEQGLEPDYLEELLSL